MVHDLFRGFDVPEEHGRVARDAQIVGDVVHVEPLISGKLFRANILSDPCGEDLRSSARQGIQAGCLQHRQYLGDRFAGAIRKPLDLDGSQGLYRCRRQHPLGDAKQLDIVVKAQFPVQAADDVNVCESPSSGSLEPFFNLLKAQRISLARPGFAPECTQAAAILA